MYRNHTALLWADYNASQNQAEDFDRLGTMLGTRWTRDQVVEMFQKQKSQGQANETVMIPLAFTIQPEFAEALKSLFGTSGHKPGWVASASEIVEASTLPREQFLAMTATSSIAAKVQALRMKRGDAPQTK